MSYNYHASSITKKISGSTSVFRWSLNTYQFLSVIYDLQQARRSHTLLLWLTCMSLGLHLPQHILQQQLQQKRHPQQQQKNPQVRRPNPKNTHCNEEHQSQPHTHNYHDNSIELSALEANRTINRIGESHKNGRMQKFRHEPWTRAWVSTRGVCRRLRTAPSTSVPSHQVHRRPAITSRW